MTDIGFSFSRLEDSRPEQCSRYEHPNNVNQGNDAFNCTIEDSRKASLSNGGQDFFAIILDGVSQAFLGRV